MDHRSKLHGDYRSGIVKDKWLILAKSLDADKDSRDDHVVMIDYEKVKAELKPNFSPSITNEIL